MNNFSNTAARSGNGINHRQVVNAIIALGILFFAGRFIFRGGVNIYEILAFSAFVFLIVALASDKVLFFPNED